MAFKVNDLVRVIGCLDGADSFDTLRLNTVAPIVAIWEGENFPYELEGFPADCVHESEIELVAGGSE